MGSSLKSSKRGNGPWGGEDLYISKERGGVENLSTGRRGEDKGALEGKKCLFKNRGGGTAAEGFRAKGEGESVEVEENGIHQGSRRRIKKEASGVHIPRGKGRP